MDSCDSQADDAHCRIGLRSRDIGREEMFLDHIFGIASNHSRLFLVQNEVAFKYFTLKTDTKQHKTVPNA